MSSARWVMAFIAGWAMALAMQWWSPWASLDFWPSNNTILGLMWPGLPAVPAAVVAGGLPVAWPDRWRFAGWASLLSTAHVCGAALLAHESGPSMMSPGPRELWGLALLTLGNVVLTGAVSHIQARPASQTCKAGGVET